MNLLTGSAIYNEDGDLLASVSLSRNWNGQITMTIQPQNVTTELVYDTSGRVFSATTPGSDGLQFVEITSVVSDSTVKSYMFGDQVSIRVLNIRHAQLC